MQYRQDKGQPRSPAVRGGDSKEPQESSEPCTEQGSPPNPGRRAAAPPGRAKAGEAAARVLQGGPRLLSADGAPAGRAAAADRATCKTAGPQTSEPSCGGAALALPLLNGMRSNSGMTWAQDSEHGKLPKRMLVSYFAYGAYMPNGASGVPSGNKPHHDWSWWPCSVPGPLTFNQSSKPFEPLKDQISYLRGLDHKGGWSMGGHSSGDVFATGADMTEQEKTNNISIDQLAANTHGHHTRYASLVLGTEGGTGSYGSSKTLSHRGPGRPIPSMHKPQEIFNGLFLPYEGKGIEQVRAGLKREASILDLMMEHSRSFSRKISSRGLAHQPSHGRGAPELAVMTDADGMGECDHMLLCIHAVSRTLDYQRRLN